MLQIYTVCWMGDRLIEAVRLGFVRKCNRKNKFNFFIIFSWISEHQHIQRRVQQRMVYWSIYLSETSNFDYYEKSSSTDIESIQIFTRIAKHIFGRE